MVIQKLSPRSRATKMALMSRRSQMREFTTMPCRGSRCGEPRLPWTFRRRYRRRASPLLSPFRGWYRSWCVRLVRRWVRPRNISALSEWWSKRSCWISRSLVRSQIACQRAPDSIGFRVEGEAHDAKLLSVHALEGIKLVYLVEDCFLFTI